MKSLKIYLTKLYNGLTLSARSYNTEGTWYKKVYKNDVFDQIWLYLRPHM